MQGEAISVVDCSRLVRAANLGGTNSRGEKYSINRQLGATVKQWGIDLMCFIEQTHQCGRENHSVGTTARQMRANEGQKVIESAGKIQFGSKQHRVAIRGEVPGAEARSVSSSVQRWT